MKLTNLNKIFWPKEKLTKGDLLEYYAQIAPYILPHLKNRPIVLTRFPDGIQGESFYQKNAGPGTPDFVKTVEIQHEDKKISYILVQNAQTLLYVANLGAIELHSFTARVKNLLKPDYMVLDIDTEKGTFSDLLEVAQFLHETLDAIKIPNYCKTSGGSGLHIYVPTQGKYDYEQTQKFAYSLGNLAREKFPRLVSLERMPQKRLKKIYIDYLQNRKLHTMVSVYSARGKPHATVSTPLEWKEVKRGLNPAEFTIETVPDRLSKKGDLFQDVLKKKAEIPSK